MGTTKDGVYQGGINLRRKTAKELLEAQLVKGEKPRKNGMSWKDYPEEDIIRFENGDPAAIRLSEKDIKRINKELSVLKERI